MRLLLFLYIVLQLAATPMNEGNDADIAAREKEGSAAASAHRRNAVLLHNRLTGTPPSTATLAKMVKLLQQQKQEEAALLATEVPDFYDVRLLSMFSAWSNVDANIDVELNDMIATLIGMVKDDVPFKEALYGDHLYLISEREEPEKVTYEEREIGKYAFTQFAYYEATEGDIFVGGSPKKEYRVHANTLYTDYIQNLRRINNLSKESSQEIKLMDLLHGIKQSDLHNYGIRTRVEKIPASEYTKKRDPSIYNADRDNVYLIHYEPVSLPEEAIAGILSTRGFAKAYYSAGTNRRATAFVLKYFLCHDMNMLHDTSIKQDFIRRDVDRAPSGDTQIYEEKCAGCHAGMDALSGWNVHYDFGRQSYVVGEQLLYNSQQVNKKINKNDLGGGGHVPQDDSFINLWTEGQNSILGWPSTTYGNGAKAWGKMLAESDAFASCMATHAFEQVCLSKPDTKDEQEDIDKMAYYFVTHNYSMKKLFAATAVSCLLKE